jgi:carboxyl-terminal processing protease
MSDLSVASDPSTSADHPLPTADYATQDYDPPHRRGARWTTLLAVFLVVAIGGGALFVSGFALGRLAGATPGTTADNQDLFRPFWDAYNDIVSNYVGKDPVDQHALVEGAIGGLFTALGDPFSQYLTQEQYTQTLSGLSGEFTGVGVQVQTVDASGNSCDTVSDTCQLVITHVVRNSPAQTVGLMDNDVITAIDNAPTTGMTVDDVAGKLRGPKGTTVAITIDRSGQAMDFTVTRDVIQREDVTTQVLADGKVGYMKLAAFSSGSSDDFHNLLNELVNTDHVQAIVLDLRDDPGGYVDAAQKIASEFVTGAPLYFEQAATGDPQPQQPIAGGVATDPAIPVVVLVNGGTASASEIVSAAIQGNGRGQLVGSKTYGKGTIQEFKELPGAGGYRLSVDKWLTPDLTWIHGVGLFPNVESDPPDNQPANQDAVLAKGIEVVLAQLANPTATFPPPPTAPPPTPSASPSAVTDQSGVLEVALAGHLAVG